MTKKIMLLLTAAFSINTTYSQNTFKAILKDSTSQELLVGATAVVKGTTNGASSNISGEVTITNIANGEHTIVFTYVGYKTQEQKFSFPFLRHG